MRRLQQKAPAAALTLAATILLASCGDAPSSSVGGEAGLQGASSVELVSVSVDEWHQEIAAMQGDIVVSDMWATWCIPCIEKFPQMVEMSKRYEGRGVRFISTCLDDPTDELSVAYAREFLQEQQATFNNYLIDGNLTDTFEQLDLLTIPAVFIFGRDGELRYRLTADDPYNQFTDADVESALEGLLALDASQAG